MLKLFKLVKIDILTYFNLYKIRNAKGFSQKIKELFKFLFVILIFGIFGFYIYMFAKLSIGGYIALNIEYVLLGEFFALSSTFALLTSIFKVDGLLFNNKDYDMLISMPIKKTTIISSKLANLYFSNLIFTLVIMVPVLFVYVQYVSVSVLFYILYILSLFIIPLIPTVIAVIIGSLITIITSRFKLKKLMQGIFLLAVLVGAMYFSFKANDFTNMDFANIGSSMVNMFDKIYPLTKVYMNMVIDFDFKSIVIFMFIPIIVYIIANYIISLFYSNIVTKINEKSTRKKYKTTNINSSKPLFSLVKKEFKRYLSSPYYIFNSTAGVLLLLIASVAMLFINPDKISEFLGIPNLMEMIQLKGPFVIGLMLALCSTTSSSISLEGKSLWIIKSMPVETSKIFWSKIILNLSLLIIPGIISSLIIFYILKLNLITLALFIITIVLYSLLISIGGLIVNLHFPLLKWENEIKVIKQSTASFVSIMIGLVIGMIPLVITPNISANLFIALVDSIIFVVVILLIIYMNIVGKKQFDKLNN